MMTSAPSPPPPSPFFRGVAQRPLTVRWEDDEGAQREARVMAPGVYPDVASMWAFFSADLDAARRLLPDEGRGALEPLPFTRGRGLVAIHAFRYRQSPVGPYDEVSVGVAVRPPGELLPPPLALARAALCDDLHGFVVQLPVTTEPALQAGLQLFGYPKFLADVRFEEDAASWRVAVRNRETGALLYALRGAKLMARRPGRVHALRLLSRPAPHGPGVRVTRFHSYPALHGRLHHAVLHFNALARTSHVGRGCAIELGDDPRAAALRALRMGAPLQYTYAPRAEVLLEAPTPL